MAKSYGMINFLASFGFTERWRIHCINGIDWSSVERAYDLMSGMGETWDLIFTKKLVQLVGVDITSEMNAKARKKIHENENWQVQLLEMDVLHNTIPDADADCIISSFGLKHFSNNQLHQLAKEIDRILKPGGQLSLVEISVPEIPLLRILYLFYLNAIIPIIGKLFLGNPDNYRMLGRYCQEFTNCRMFLEILEKRGLSVVYKRYFYGCATGITGRKPL